MSGLVLLTWPCCAIMQYRVVSYLACWNWSVNCNYHWLDTRSDNVALMLQLDNGSKDSILPQHSDLSCDCKIRQSYAGHNTTLTSSKHLLYLALDIKRIDRLKTKLKNHEKHFLLTGISTYDVPWWSNDHKECGNLPLRGNIPECLAVCLGWRLATGGYEPLWCIVCPRVLTICQFWG